MRSIRLSLVLYFLVLLAAGLGAVSVLAYQSTERVLRSNQETRTTLIDSNYENACEAVRKDLDQRLVHQAGTIAARSRLGSQWGRVWWAQLAPWNLLSVAVDPSSYLLAPLWLREAGFGERGRGPRPGDLRRLFITLLATHIEFSEDLLPSSYASGPLQEYYQINSDFGVWRSHSLQEGGLSFPFNLRGFRKRPLNEAELDEVELRPGLRVRRVTLKATVARFGRPPWLLLPRPRPDRRPEPPPPPRESPEVRAVLDAGALSLLAPAVSQGAVFTAAAFFPGGIPPEREAPALLIQCAAETSYRDAELTRLGVERDLNLTHLREESRDTLAGFRDQLLLISLITFAATVLGGFWLVRAGLAPLRRLSVAVSQVSARDFRLPLDDRPLPRELRPIVERLKVTLGQLQRAFAREKQAAADISHELRTPVAALLTTLEVGLRKPRSSEEYREILSDCRATGKHMSQLVERLLALARLDAGVDNLRPQTVDAGELAGECASLVRPLAEAREVELQVHRNGPTSVRADPNKLREILTNLLHNAIEYNRPHGHIDLTVERQDGFLYLEVRDTGVGIPAAARPHLFERFFRADPSRHADGLHAGLGLAIVKGYVDLMGGRIRVESTEGEGSTFRVELPAA